MDQEEYEDTKGVIRIHKSKKDRQHIDQKKKDKGQNYNLQNTTQKTNDQQHEPYLKPGVTQVFFLDNTQMIHEWKINQPLTEPRYTVDF
jgi:hypothetical protein